MNNVARFLRDNAVFVLIGLWVGIFLWPAWPGWTLVFFIWIIVLTAMIQRR